MSSPVSFKAHGWSQLWVRSRQGGVKRRALQALAATRRVPHTEKAALSRGAPRRPTATGAPAARPPHGELGRGGAQTIGRRLARTEVHAPAVSGDSHQVQPRGLPWADWRNVHHNRTLELQ